MQCKECKTYKRGDNCQACYLKTKKKLEKAENQIIKNTEVFKNQISARDRVVKTALSEVKKIELTLSIVKDIAKNSSVFKVRKLLREYLEEITNE